jgi:hypothetical protein
MCISETREREREINTIILPMPTLVEVTVRRFVVLKAKKNTSIGWINPRNNAEKARYKAARRVGFKEGLATKLLESRTPGLPDALSASNFSRGLCSKSMVRLARGLCEAQGSSRAKRVQNRPTAMQYQTAVSAPVAEVAPRHAIFEIDDRMV